MFELHACERAGTSPSYAWTQNLTFKKWGGDTRAFRCDDLSGKFYAGLLGLPFFDGKTFELDGDNLRIERKDGGADDAHADSGDEL